MGQSSCYDFQILVSESGMTWGGGGEVGPSRVTRRGLCLLGQHSQFSESQERWVGLKPEAEEMVRCAEADRGPSSQTGRPKGIQLMGSASYVPL